MLTSAIDLVAFSSILYSIYPQLFVAIIAYASLGTVITTSLGKRLVGLNFLQLQREAFFRYSLMRVRENSESIAFYGGEALEMKEIRRRLDAVLENLREIIGTQRNLEFFTVSYRFRTPHVAPNHVLLFLIHSRLSCLTWRRPVEVIGAYPVCMSMQ